LILSFLEAPTKEYAIVPVKVSSGKREEGGI
jgi:hypothetical protein